MSVFWDCSDDLWLLRTLGRYLDRRLPGWPSNLRDLLVRNFLWVRDKHGRLVRLRPNRTQAEFAARASGRDLVLKARQLGITTWIAARFFVSTITRPGTVTVLVAHDQRAAQEIFRIVHRFLDHLPACLRLRALVTSRDNVGQLVFPLLDSEYRVESAADPNAGRGLTIHRLHCSEVARWPRDAAATLASLRAAVPPDGEIVLESTPNGAAGCFYNEWQRAPSTGYTRHFFPWWYETSYTVDRRPAIDDLSSEERALVAEHGLTLGQIAFRRQMRANFAGLARQEFAEDPNSCFLASGECVFDMEVLNRRLAECSSEAASNVDFANRQRPMANRVAEGLVEAHGFTRGKADATAETPGFTCGKADATAKTPGFTHGKADATVEALGFTRGKADATVEAPGFTRGKADATVEAPSFSRGNSAAEIKGASAPVLRPIESRDNGRLLLWWPPRPGAGYILGVDPAGGGCEGDYSCAQLIERVTGLQCAELHGHIPPQELATRLAELGREYNGALIAVERNNHGHGVIAYLAAYEKYPRLYEQNRQAGWLTTAISRPRMIEQLAALVARQPDLFASPRLLAECRTFVRQPDGAAAAAAGAHDDCVLAMAIAQAVRLELAGGHRPAPELDFASLAR